MPMAGPEWSVGHVCDGGSWRIDNCDIPGTTAGCPSSCCAKQSGLLWLVELAGLQCVQAHGLNRRHGVSTLKEPLAIYVQWLCHKVLKFCHMECSQGSGL